MKLTAILYIMSMLIPVVCLAQQDRRLEGCVEPKIIATVLASMRQEKSRPISEEKFRAMWPTELADFEVDPPADSRSLRSDDRILKGHCECCEVFTFNLRQDGGATLLELDGVTVNYSAGRRDTLVAMAKLFAQSVGLRASDMKTIGAEQSQGYQWEKIKGKERRAYLIDLRFTREKGLWKMYFDTAFYIVEASASPSETKGKSQPNRP
jgi:hypothetical protein